MKMVGILTVEMKLADMKEILLANMDFLGQVKTIEAD
jgi:hypothetical protein